MNTTTTISPSPSVSWRAILAGAVVALSVHLLLTTLGASITSFAAKPANSDTPVQTFTIGLAVSWTLSALISLWLGGCVSARLACPGDREGGMMHGFIMWSLATVIGFILVAGGVGKALGTAGRVVGGAVSTAATAAASAVPDLAKTTGDLVNQYSGELNPNGQPLTPAQKREVATNLKTLLMNGDAGRTPENRQALVNVVSRVGGITPEEAGKTVDEWAASFDRAKAEFNAGVDAAAKKVTEATNHAASVAGVTGIWTFIAFWLGAVAAVWGGRSGADGLNKFPPARPVTA